MYQATIPQRLRKLRERRGVNQVDLSQALGFSDRQTLSDIELGKRNVTPEELVRAALYFDVKTDYFTDPFELAGEARFSWRKTASSADDLEAFYKNHLTACKHMGFYRVLVKNPCVYIQLGGFCRKPSNAVVLYFSLNGVNDQHPKWGK